jgi:LPXTG-motif cell wall-anchored protein
MANKPAPAAGSTTTPAQTSRVGAAGPAARTEPVVAARPAPDAAPEAAPDTGSSGFIFYTGVGIATVVLLLSLAAFVRSRDAEAGRPPAL